MKYIRNIFTNWHILIIGLAIGALITTGLYLLIKPEPAPVDSLEKSLLAWGGSISKGRYDDNPARYTKLDDTYVFPLSSKEASSSGWSENGQCVTGIGRYFSNPDLPNLLIYNKSDELIGVYLYSYDPMSNPWTKSDSLVIPTNLTLIDGDHWSVSLYFQNPSKACEL
tara:strand:+ start:1224 stop:1727 length:504 start_codon:yes stop_codon:yes gene_type:complete